MQAANGTAVQGAPDDRPILIAPAPPNWEDIPRPFRTAAEDCVWDFAQSQVDAHDGEIEEPHAAEIGRASVAACDESISAWADHLSEREVRRGELPEYTDSRLRAHMAARGKEFTLGVSERFYIDEDRGQDTEPSFVMSETCDAQMRRAQQLRLDFVSRVEEVRDELRDVPLEEQQSLRYSQMFMELMSEAEISERRIQMVQRRCPQFITDVADGPVRIPEGMQ